jgi:2-dehydro-3-deoxy-D-arabinonate dehydratase
MKLGQIKWHNKVVAAIFDTDGQARPIPDHTLHELVVRADKQEVEIAPLAKGLAQSLREPAAPLIPLQPREVWACGCTYESSAAFRDAEHGTREGFYAHVYRATRPEIFFKGTARECVGPGQNIGIRSDSKFTAPEPELAVVLGSKGRVVGYTLANDVSAWDIERENPLYLPQSKMYACSCAIGPFMVTTDELTDPYSVTITCTITRNGATLFFGETSTSKLNRKIEEMTEYLLRSNPVPAGSVLLTGTGIIVTEEAALAAGDIVTIASPQIGELTNAAIVV